DRFWNSCVAVPLSLGCDPEEDDAAARVGKRRRICKEFLLVWIGSPWEDCLVFDGARLRDLCLLQGLEIVRGHVAYVLALDPHSRNLGRRLPRAALRCLAAVAVLKVPLVYRTNPRQQPQAPPPLLGHVPRVVPRRMVLHSTTCFCFGEP